MDRRAFLGRTVGLAGASLAAGAWMPTERTGSVGSIRNSGGASVTLELGGTDLGAIRGVTSGAPVGTVAPLAGGKAIRNISWEPFALDVDVAMPQALATWINDSWQGSNVFKNGAVEISDTTAMNRRREFQDGVLSEVVLPECHAGRSTPASVAVGLRPVTVRWKKASIEGKQAATLPKSWTCDRFQFQIVGLDGSQVMKVGPYVVTQELTPDPTGVQRETTFSLSSRKFGNLQLWVPESAAAPWAAWAEDFLINGSGAEKTAMLGFMAPDMTTYLAYAVFFGVGVVRYDDLLEDDEPTRHAAVELYVERAEFHLGTPPAGGGICPTNPCIATAGA